MSPHTHTRPVNPKISAGVGSRLAITSTGHCLTAPVWLAVRELQKVGSTKQQKPDLSYLFFHTWRFQHHGQWDALYSSTWQTQLSDLQCIWEVFTALHFFHMLYYSLIPKWTKSIVFLKILQTIPHHDKEKDLTMDSLISNSSRASSVFSCGQNRLKEEKHTEITETHSNKQTVSVCLCV